MGDRDTASAAEDGRDHAIARLTKRIADRRAAEQLSKGAQAAERASAGLGTSDEDEFGLRSASTASTGRTSPRRWR
jgi:hypothetical protein